MSMDPHHVPSPPDDAVPADRYLAARCADAALAAAREAADYIRGIDRSAIDREEKTSAHDIVTVHDRACEEIIVRVLRAALPGCRIVGEEGGERPALTDDGDDGARVTFFVDPIDGTSNFAAGMPLFCVSIGAAIDDRLVAGVIDLPILGQVFTAGPGGARLNGEPLTPRATRPAREALVLTNYPSVGDLGAFPEESLADRAHLSRALSSVRSLGSAAIELAWVAAGWADATALARIHSWDIAAGFLLVEQAGGSIRTWPGRGPADLPAHEMPAYVACTGRERIEELDAVLDAVQARREAAAAERM